jgi:hypothetical protein
MLSKFYRIFLQIVDHKGNIRQQVAKKSSFQNRNTLILLVSF